MQRTLAWLSVAVLGFAGMVGRALPAGAQVPTVGGNSITVPISLPGGIGGELAVTFETVSRLDLASLGVSVRLVSPLDPGLLSRLPPGTTIPLGFPVVVQIEPTPDGGLAFTGATAIQIASPTLPPTPDLRILTDSLGGAFHDATTVGWDTSYRVIGATGGFSEFVIVLDKTPRAQAVAAKLDRLSALLSANADAIAPPVRTELTVELAALRARIQGGQTTAAVQELDAFLATVGRHAGVEIPNVWRATRDVVDVAGLLTAAGKTLRFSLQLGP